MQKMFIIFFLLFTWVCLIFEDTIWQCSLRLFEGQKLLELSSMVHIILWNSYFFTSIFHRMKMSFKWFSSYVVVIQIKQISLQKFGSTFFKKSWLKHTIIHQVILLHSSNIFEKFFFDCIIFQKSH